MVAACDLQLQVKYNRLVLNMLATSITHPIRLFYVSVLKSPDTFKLSKVVLHIQLATIHKLVLSQKQIKIVQQHANI